MGVEKPFNSILILHWNLSSDTDHIRYTGKNPEKILSFFPKIGDFFLKFAKNSVYIFFTHKNNKTPCLKVYEFYKV